MQVRKLHNALKTVMVVVLSAMAAAVLYSAYIAIRHWTGIGV